ncbi:uncharacterized protein FOMMEDRAFT_151239 [Fomitiporia mediterranea MF3/22]|uniref:uncharacterized protein n=1 Tax=Fomitiporia mediterranea (strain MF3/22) TaxID=694068 RepID=UPI00044096EF|nr:uncharacterized protein FOMMEDRAFT_151239 [Fomitiporia mediterranea MF3/22]EJD08390.1 hypothetical protein FOMMEDRAFT_151239 [Fomitiporia mediterranea MF3/22]
MGRQWLASLLALIVYNVQSALADNDNGFDENPLQSMARYSSNWYSLILPACCLLLPTAPRTDELMMPD